MLYLGAVLEMVPTWPGGGIRSPNWEGDWQMLGECLSPHGHVTTANSY